MYLWNGMLQCPYMLHITRYVCKDKSSSALNLLTGGHIAESLSLQTPALAALPQVYAKTSPPDAQKWSQNGWDDQPQTEPAAETLQAPCGRRGPIIMAAMALCVTTIE